MRLGLTAVVVQVTKKPDYALTPYREIPGGEKDQHHELHAQLVSPHMAPDADTAPTLAHYYSQLVNVNHTEAS